MEKDMFEKFRDGELPKEIQAQVITSANIHGIDDEKKWWFTAGFFCCEKIKEIRQIEGIED